MSRTFASVSFRWFALVVVVLVLSPTDSLGARVFTGGVVSGNDYEDAVHGAGHVEGDIWGGEQGSEPDILPIGPIVGESTPLINTLPGAGKPKPQPVPNAGQGGWLYQLGAFFDWLGTALRIQNL